jgi:O-antigen/teichoic acid export membrane protein
LFKIIRTFFTTGHERTLKAKKNIVVGFFVRGISILANMALIPVTINYLNPTKFGIWVTLSSIIGWFSFLDIGLGNGLRNKFAEALAKGNKELAKVYVSTTYATLTIIVIIVFMAFLCLNPFLTWTYILNSTEIVEEELSLLAMFIFALFCIRIVLQLISTILTADQKPIYSNIFKLFWHLLSLLMILILTKTTHENFLLLGISISISPIVVLLLSSIWFFKRSYKYYRPKINNINFKYTRDLLNVGFQFFFIVICSVIIYQSSNLIISHLFSVSDVTPYNIALRYYMVGTVSFGIIMQPFWTAHTDAYAKNDHLWIVNSIKKLLKIWFLFLCGMILMTVFADIFYKFWVGENIQVPFLVSVFMAIYVSLLSFGSIFVMFINGVGKIKLQLVSSLIGALIFVPTAIYFAKNTDLHISGIIVATIIANFYGPILAPIQYYKIVNGTAEGIWNK